MIFAMLFGCLFAAVWFGLGAWAWWKDFGDLFSEKEPMTWHRLLLVSMTLLILFLAMAVGPFAFLCVTPKNFDS